MRMKTLSLTAAFFLAAATAASACNWSKDTVAQTPVDTKKMSEPVQMAQAPVDLWLVDYLKAWEQA